MVRFIFISNKDIDECFLLRSGLENEKGKILGIFRSLQALARATGPLIASFGEKKSFFDFLSIIFDVLSFSAYWSIGEQTTYIFGGFLLICPFVILLSAQNRFKNMRVLPTITVSEAKDD